MSLLPKYLVEPTSALGMLLFLFCKVLVFLYRIRMQQQSKSQWEGEQYVKCDVCYGDGSSMCCRAQPCIGNEILSYRHTIYLPRFLQKHYLSLISLGCQHLLLLHQRHSINFSLHYLLISKYPAAASRSSPRNYDIQHYNSKCLSVKFFRSTTPRISIPMISAAAEDPNPQGRESKPSDLWLPFP